MGGALKILAIADLHGQADRLQSLEAKDADLIVVCGDLHNARGADEVWPVVRALADLGLPVFIVPGNMDPRPSASLMWKQAGFISLHRRASLYGNFGFIGMGGIVARGDRSPDNPARYYHRDEDVYDILTRGSGEDGARSPRPSGRGMKAESPSSGT